jgi:hypothetical protein
LLFDRESGKVRFLPVAQKITSTSSFALSVSAKSFAESFAETSDNGAGVFCVKPLL